LAQERLWFLEQIKPGSPVFNLCRALRVFGTLNVAALESSVNEILRRHEALRTKINDESGRAVQRIALFRRMHLPVADLSKLSDSDRQRESNRLARQAARRPFDLGRGRLLRAKLVRLSGAEHILVVCTHHIVSDAWSMGVLVDELWCCYRAFASGENPSLAGLPIQYRDYALWQRDESSGAAAKPHLLYWQTHLAGAPLLDLPTDRLRPERQSFRGARQPIEIAAPITKALYDLSRREGATLFMTLLAGFQLLLHRYTGQNDIVVGTPVANRGRCELEAVIGLFVNTLALRVDLSGEPSFLELLRRVRESCLNGYARQDMPFEKVVAALRPARELNRHPLFQAMFVLQNTPRRWTAPAGLRLETVEVDNAGSQLDLSLYLRERDGKLIGYFEYASDLFDAVTIGRMAGHFETLLDFVSADPGQSIATLPLLSEIERRQLLMDWNDTAVKFPGGRCIHELFEVQAEGKPDAVALEFDGAQLTYGELNRRANQLANYLRARGVGPRMRVGICVARSFEMVIGLLGILKAGAAYVPLDPAYPRERLKFMLQDSQLSILLITKTTVDTRGWRIEDRDPRSSIPSTSLRTGLDPRVPTVHIDQDWQSISRQSDKDPQSGARADSPAYVIYTSGSTGVPKGVVGLHRGAVNRFAWMWRRYPFGATEVCCGKTSLSFVDSVWEIFGPLLHGVRLVIASDEVARDPQRLVRFLADHHVTRVVSVPSLLNAILEEVAALSERLPELRYWTSSGEALPGPLAERFKKSHPDAVLLNLYGSAEVAADVTYYEYRGPTAATTVPIGRPIANTQIYLLDSHMQPVPVGVAGELFVSGAGVARGYWNRPDLTRKKFVAHPYSSDPKARLFRTGDLARYLADGNIEYLGRADRQIKIRGQRVELGEIEATLKLHPAICECAVVAPADSGTDSSDHAKIKTSDAPSIRSLVGYIVAEKSPAPSAADLRDFVKHKLPDFMVPSKFVALAALPLSPNGKVDRSALPLPPDLPVPTAGEIFEPRTEIEFLVAQVWQDALRLERVDLTANFFDLGGHSLLGAEVVAKLRALFKRPISLREIFETPTVEGLSASLARALRGDGDVELPPILPRPDSHHAPLTPGQEQLYLFSQLFGGGDFLNMPYAYRLTGVLDPVSMARAIGEIIRRHKTLRTSFVELNGRAVQQIARQRRFKLPTTDLSRLASGDRAARLERISRSDAARSFDLEKAPLLRARLIRMAEREHVLLVTLHHIVADQWSMGVFRRELAEIYAAFAKGLPASLPALRLQFADFAAWQHELLKNGALKSEIDYWRRQLAGPLGRLDFRPERKRKKAIRFQSARRRIEVDDKLFAAVKAFARRQNSTPFMILIAALDILLYKITGERDIRVATLVADRNRPGTEGLIGYFVNAIVLRARLNAEMKIQALLERVRAVCLDAYAHQEVPFEYLETEVSRITRGSRVPLFQVMFNYRSQASEPLQAAGLTIASWYGEHRAANPGIDISRLDLNFHLREVSTQLTGVVNFRIDLFDESRIAALIEGFQMILRQVVAHPDRRLADISLH
jgi:amino acid adenylation domain-containing protein